MSEDVHPYAIPAENPTTEIIISWIDERDDSDHDIQHLDYGTDPDDLEYTEESEGEVVPESSDAYHFSVKLTDLQPASEYHARIRCSQEDNIDGITFKTLPKNAGDGLKIALISDIHINSDGGMESPSDIDVVADERPDLYIIIGDTVTGGDEVSSITAGEWLEFFDDYVERLNDDGLRPIFMAPGNHDVGNSRWDGTESVSVNPEAGYYQFFWQNPAELDPVGENYGQIIISDYLQLVGLDTNSAYPHDVADWLEGAIDEDVPLCIPFHHSPLLPGADRGDEDTELQEKLRNDWAEIFYSSGNIPIHFNGHIHSRKRTHPWSFVEDEPDGDFTELDEGYVTRDDADGIIELGDGFRYHERDDLDDWWLDNREYNASQYYTLEISPESLTVEEKNENGSVYNTETFDIDFDTSLVDMQSDFEQYGKLTTKKTELHKSNG